MGKRGFLEAIFPFNLLDDWKVGKMEGKCVKPSPRSPRSNGFDTPSATQPGAENRGKKRKE